MCKNTNADENLWGVVDPECWKKKCRSPMGDRLLRLMCVTGGQCFSSIVMRVPRRCHLKWFFQPEQCFMTQIKAWSFLSWLFRPKH